MRSCPRRRCRSQRVNNHLLRTLSSRSSQGNRRGRTLPPTQERIIYQGAQLCAAVSIAEKLGHNAAPAQRQDIGTGHAGAECIHQAERLEKTRSFPEMIQEVRKDGTLAIKVESSLAHERLKASAFVSTKKPACSRLTNIYWAASTYQVPFRHSPWDPINSSWMLSSTHPRGQVGSETLSNCLAPHAQ